MADAPYGVVLTRTARRDLSERLPEAVAAAAANLILGDLATNPHRVGKQLRPPLERQHSARRGTFRIVYEIDELQHVVRVVAVKARNDVYGIH